MDGEDFQDLKDKGLKCITCSYSYYAYDRERPCGRYIEKKQNCNYVKQEGLVTRTYKVEGALQKFKKVPPKGGGCITYRSKGRKCDRQHPCTKCVTQSKTARANGWNKTYKTYSYRHNGFSEGYTIETHTIEDGKTILKPDWEQHTRSQGEDTRKAKPGAPSQKSQIH